MTFLYLENFDLQEGFLKKQTQFSESSNVLDNSACNMEGMIWRETCVSSV
jgi:hypothetical protein